MKARKTKRKAKRKKRSAGSYRTKQRNEIKRRTKSARLYRTEQRKRKLARKRLDPIPQSYGPLRRAFVLLNRRLFNNELPACLITLQRKRSALGYFAGRRFKSTAGAHITDEIALNPTHFSKRGAKNVLSTLAHELAHQWQQHFGKPSRAAYHNKEWAAKMCEIGLIPSDTGRPGGKQTGQRMTHYIKRGGPFDRAADELIAKGFVLAFVERIPKNSNLVAVKKRLSKTTYHCPKCFAKAWAKPGSDFSCRPCGERLVSRTIGGWNATRRYER